MKKQKLINLEGKKKRIMSLLFLKKNGCQMLTPDYRCNYTSDYRFMFWQNTCVAVAQSSAEITSIRTLYWLFVATNSFEQKQ